MEHKTDNQKIIALKQRFIQWIELKTDQSFTLSHNLQLACLDEALELGYYKSLKGLESKNALSVELMMKGLLASWVNHATLLLEQTVEEEFIYRGIEFSEKKHQELRLRLLNEIRHISLLCSGAYSI